MTACAAPQLFQHRQTRQYRLAPCRCWHCASCARLLAFTWRAVLNWTIGQGCAPQYMITLTCRRPLPLWKQAHPSERESQRSAATAMARSLTRAFSALVRDIRRTFGPFEYLAFVELTTGRRTPGHRPHLHLLVRGPEIPRHWLSSRWQFHTRDSFRVDVQRLRSPWLAADYLVGYTVGRRKKEQQQHLTHWPGPRIRYSRGYFPRRVVEVRQLLAAIEADGLWQWLGRADAHWYSRLKLARHAASVQAAVPANGSRASKHHKESENAAAKQTAEVRPEQGYRYWLTCPCRSGYLADCRPGHARSYFARLSGEVKRDGEAGPPSRGLRGGRCAQGAPQRRGAGLLWRPAGDG